MLIMLRAGPSVRPTEAVVSGSRLIGGQSLHSSLLLPLPGLKKKKKRRMCGGEQGSEV